MSKRQELVDWARQQVGSNDRAGYWRQALGYDPGVKKAWCGAFYLAGLKHVGLTGIKWGIDGTGLQALRLKPTRHPQPGDLGYQDQPWQHHFLVEDVNESAGTYSSIDGNQGVPGVQRKLRAFKTTGVIFYTIESLLRDTAPVSPYPTLKLGADSDVVATLQTLLNTYQAAGLTTDGKFGPKTARAVQIFQRDHGLDPDGVVGPKTWAKLLGSP